MQHILEGAEEHVTKFLQAERGKQFNRLLRRAIQHAKKSQNFNGPLKNLPDKPAGALFLLRTYDRAYEKSRSRDYFLFSVAAYLLGLPIASPVAEIVAELEGAPDPILENYKKADQFIAGTGASFAVVETALSRGIYKSDRDVIHIRPKDKFWIPDYYYYSVFHELILWTAPRLKRPHELFFEECVAERGAYLLSLRFDLTGPDRKAFLTSHTKKRDAPEAERVEREARAAIDYLLSL